MAKTMEINYHNKRFISISNTVNGDVGEGTVFQYFQVADIVWGTYQGGQVAMGNLIARVLANGKLDMRYQHVTRSGMIQTGTCQSTPEITNERKLRLHEQWQWTSGDFSTGTSIVEEIT